MPLCWAFTTEILAKHHIITLSAELLQNTGREAVPKKPWGDQEWGVDSSEIHNEHNENSFIVKVRL